MTPALVIDGVEKRFGGFAALAGVSFQVPAGQRRIILGPNGAGKTLLMDIIGGQIRPSRGRVIAFGQDVTRWPAWRRASAGIARTFQLNNLFPSLTVRENLALALRSPANRDNARGREYSEKRMDDLLVLSGLGAQADVPIRDLAYGDQRKIEVLLALHTRPRLLLLDEPTTGLSPAECQGLLDFLRQVDRTVTMLMVEHNLDVAFRLAEWATVLAAGRVIADGPLEVVRANDEVRRLYLGRMLGNEGRSSTHT